jgi:hypothetical protein
MIAPVAVQCSSSVSDLTYSFKRARRSSGAISYESAGEEKDSLVWEKRVKPSLLQSIYMQKWLTDIAIGLTSLAIFLILLIGLPAIVEPGYAYLIALLIFILTLIGAGYTVIEKTI